MEGRDDDDKKASSLSQELSSQELYDCAFCGEENEVTVDGSGARVQRFTEDCAVCCRPNLLSITIHHDNSIEIAVEQEYEA